VISSGIVCFSALVNDFTTYAFFQVPICRTSGVRGAREATVCYHPTTVYNDVKYIIILCTYRDENNIMCTIPTCELIRGRSVCTERVDGLCSKIKNKRPGMRFASCRVRFASRKLYRCRTCVV